LGLLTFGRGGKKGRKTAKKLLFLLAFSGLFNALKKGIGVYQNLNPLWPERKKAFSQTKNPFFLSRKKGNPGWFFPLFFFRNHPKKKGKGKKRTTCDAILLISSEKKDDTPFFKPTKTPSNKKDFYLR